MSSIENYHGNPEEDMELGTKKQRRKIYKNTPENIPDPDTVSEMPGVDLEDWSEESYRNLNKADRSFKAEEADRDVLYEDTSENSRIWDNKVNDWVEQSEEIAKAKNEMRAKEELEALMSKMGSSYDESHIGSDFQSNPLEQTNEPMEAKGDVSVSKKRESMSQRIRPSKSYTIKDQGQPYQSKDIGKSAKDNLKTMPDTKKQRTFRERIRKFLDFN